MCASPRTHTHSEDDECKWKTKTPLGKTKSIKHVWTPFPVLWHAARWLAVISALGWGGTLGDKSIQIARAEGKHFTLHSFREDKLQLPCPTLRLWSLWSSIWRQRSLWLFEKHTYPTPISHSRCVRMAFLKWFNSKISDLPTSALAEIL